ncbi:MAG: hypothetical protein P1U37_17570 [Minwuia sp.]|nr:hypothetical protein [Minwuia sp.]
MSEPDQPNFRVLKIVVIVLGIAILAMTGIIIVTAINRMGDSVVAEEPVTPNAIPVASQPVAMPVAPEGATWTSVLLPGAEAEITESAVESGVLRIVTRSGDGTVLIHLIDIRSGRKIGEVSAR